MKLTLIGLIFAVLGAVALWAGGIPYLERTELIDAGPIRATAETRETFDIPPLAAGAILALGVGLIVYDRGRN